VLELWIYPLRNGKERLKNDPEKDLEALLARVLRMDVRGFESLDWM